MRRAVAGGAGRVPRRRRAGAGAGPLGRGRATPATSSRRRRRWRWGGAGRPRRWPCCRALLARESFQDVIRIAGPRGAGRHRRRAGAAHPGGGLRRPGHASRRGGRPWRVSPGLPKGPALPARARELLERALDDRDFRVRMEAASGLVTLADARAIPALERATRAELDGRAKRRLREAVRDLTREGPAGGAGQKLSRRGRAPAQRAGRDAEPAGADGEQRPVRGRRQTAVRGKPARRPRPPSRRGNKPRRPDADRTASQKRRRPERRDRTPRPNATVVSRLGWLKRRRASQRGVQGSVRTSISSEP